MSSARVKAKAHIESIRKDRGLPDDNIIDPKNRNLADLVGALTVTSDQLYANQFHFIWEIIQNTDDANYDDQTPQLFIAVTDDGLHAWSNQTGFRHADVDSICGIGHSSKRSNAETIGEKGIGFKSLFCVADRVTIHSDPYHFKFDTTTPLGKLGMITPTWVEEAPEECGQGVVPGSGTLVSLHFKPGTDVKSLRDNLERLDFSFLIFCRRLTKVQLSYTGTRPDFSKSGELCHHPGHYVTLWTKRSKSAQPQKTSFRLFEQELADMPNQSERPQQKSSTIRLAFIQAKDWKKGLVSQMTYAFMPMKAFGFKYLIHANFILTANRGEVIHNHEWNKALRNGVADLTVEAITWFATSAESLVRFRWPHYVEGLQSIHDGFFKPLAVEVLAQLKSTRLLVTDTDEIDFFQTPEAAVLISDDFRNGGKLILDGQAMLRKSVNKSYTDDPMVSDALQLLDVDLFNHHDFLCEFEEMVLNETAAFRSRPPSWHASVASTLLASRQKFFKEFYFKCRELEIVPLTTGEWTTPGAENLFLAGEDFKDAPPIFNLLLVDSTASSDISRSLLFDLFGIKPCNRDQICQAIVADHSNDERHPAANPVAELRFLFMSNYQPRASDQLEIYYEESEFEHAEDSDIHIPFGKIGSLIRDQLGPSSVHLTWLHKDYESIPEPSRLDAFVDWLHKWPGLCLWPEVHNEHQLTPIMEDLLVAQGSIALLDHFRLRHKNGILLPADGLWTQIIRNLEVATDQGQSRLCDTALPSIARASGGIMPRIDIPEPDDQDWLFLGKFGVMTVMDARFFLEKLRQLRALEKIAPIDEMVTKLYLDLGKLAMDGPTIREAFTSEDLIYLGNRDWVRPSSCRWKASYHCTAFVVLSERYGNCRSLFKDTLQIESANLDDLLEEFSTHTTASSKAKAEGKTSEMIYQLLLDMNKLISNKPANRRQTTQMKKLRMFPISMPNSHSGSESVRLMTSSDRFWIGDSPWVRRRFIGELPLLLPILGQVTKDLDIIFRLLDMGNMRLSRSVFNEVVLNEAVGSTDTWMERWLKPRIPYMISLLEHAGETNSVRVELVAQLQNVQVQRVKGIKIRRFVWHGPTKRYAADEEGQICIKAEANALAVHIDPNLERQEIFYLLAEQLSKHWGLQHDNSQLLHKVLVSPSPDRYLEAFEKAGIIITDSGEAYLSATGAFGNNSILATTLDGIPEPSRHHSSILRDASLSPTPAPSRALDQPAGSDISTKLTNKSRTLLPIDETPTRHQVSESRGWRYAYQASSFLDNDDVEMREAFSVDKYHSRTRSWASRAQNTDLFESATQPQSRRDYSISPSKKRKHDTEAYSEELNHEIGKAGEMLVYNFLSNMLKPSFSHLNWTSGNREGSFPDHPFLDEEWRFSDFTYKDSECRLREYLQSNIPGYKAAPESVDVTFHLEVKTSLEGIATSAKLSNNQIQMARHYSKHGQSQRHERQDDEYVLVRVYNVGGGDETSTPKICFYPDPWDLICEGKLIVEGDEYLHVRPNA